MPIDPNIALSVKPIQLANPLEQFGQFQQIQGAMNQNRLADLAYGQQQREAESQNALAKLISSGASGSDVVKGLAAQGFGKQAQAYATQQQELAYKAAQTKELSSKAAKSDNDLTESKRQKAITDIAALTSPEHALESLAAHEKAGDLTPEAAAAVRATIPQNPADFPKWQIGMLQRIMAPKDAADSMMPTIQTRNTGGTTETLAIDKVTGKPTVTSSIKNTMAPGEAARVAVDRERLAFDKSQPKGQVVQTDAGPILVDPRTGQGTPVTVGGKPVPSKEAAQKTQDAKSVIDLLDMAEPLLDKATHSLLGQGYDKAAAAFGKSNEGAQAAAQLKALEGALIAKQPKMSGPQSDKDVLLYRQMAGQIGDPMIPVETRRAAMKTVRQLNEKYAGVQTSGQNNAAAPSTNSKGWTLHQDANGNKAYVSPDGKQFEEVK